MRSDFFCLKHWNNRFCRCVAIYEVWFLLTVSIAGSNKQGSQSLLYEVWFLFWKIQITWTRPRCRNPFYMRSDFFSKLCVKHQAFALRRNPFYMRSDFFWRRRLWGPVFDLVAIPSIWGLISFLLPTAWGCTVKKSQSLLYEVWFLLALREQKEREDRGRNPFYMRSDFFSTGDYELNFRAKVAIPSIWGLISFTRDMELDTYAIHVAIPSIWGLISFAIMAALKNPDESQSLLYEVWFLFVRQREAPRC